jgi:hypothetical protein
MSRHLGILSIVAIAALALAGVGSPARAQMQSQDQQEMPTRAPPHETAQQNVRQSHEYEQMLHANRGFREQRMQKECGSINDAKLHADCVASFNRDNPESGMTGRAMHHRRRRSHAAPASEQAPAPRGSSD